MILEKLKTWSYYEDLIPMYVKNSTGSTAHFRIMFELLKALDEMTDTIFSNLNITEKIEGFDFKIENAKDMIEKIGSLFGLSRNVHVRYVRNYETIDEDIVLSDEEFLQFIKAKIALNSYDGTRENANQIYDNLNLPFYMLNTNNGAEVNFYIDTPSDTLNNLAKLVLSGLMTLESMGISYVYSAMQLSNLGYWDKSKWDNQLWGI